MNSATRHAPNSNVTQTCLVGDALLHETQADIDLLAGKEGGCRNDLLQVEVTSLQSVVELDVVAVALGEGVTHGRIRHHPCTQTKMHATF